MKRFKIFALIATLALSLLVSAACGEGGSSVAASGTASTGDRTIHLLGYSRAVEGEADNWQKVIDSFEEENPGVTVDVRWQGSSSESVQNLTSAKMAGETVDLFIVGPGLINSALAEGGLLMDMTDLAEPYLDRFVESTMSGLYIGEHLWGIPFGDMSIGMVIYNKTLFDELGLEPPATFEEMVEIGNKLKENDPSMIPMMHMGKMPMFWPMWFMETYAQTSDGKSLENINEFLEGDRSFVGEEEQKAFDKIKAFLDEGLLTTESFDTDSTGLIAAFSQGKTAMFYSMGFAYTAVVNAVGDSMEIGVFPFPQVVDGAQPQHGGGTSDAIVIPSFASQENLDITMKFIEYITRSENATQIFAARDLLAPTVKGVEAADIPIRDVLNNEIIPDAMPFLDWIWPVEVNDAFMSAIPAVLAGQMDSKQATESIQNSMDTVREEQNYVSNWWDNWTQEQWNAVTPTTIPPDYSK